MPELRTRLNRSDLVGTKILRRSGYIYVKTEDGVRPGAQVVAEHKLLNRELLPGERVFHRDCSERDNNDPSNLVVIKFRTDKFRPLPTSRVIYIPRRAMQEAA